MTMSICFQMTACLRTEVLISGAVPTAFRRIRGGRDWLSRHIVQVLEAIRSLCTQLHPAKPTFDIPAIHVCKAHELIERLCEQCRPLGFAVHPARGRAAGAAMPTITPA